VSVISIYLNIVGGISKLNYLKIFFS
jgi:hypothetical protein